MASQADALMSYIDSRPVAVEFKPCAYYGEDEDAVIFYFRNEADYAKRVNKWLTLYLAMDTKELVGCQIKGVRHVLDNLGTFGIEVEHGRVKVSVVFFAFLGALPDDPEAQASFSILAQAAMDSKAELEMPARV